MRVQNGKPLDGLASASIVHERHRFDACLAQEVEYQTAEFARSEQEHGRLLERLVNGGGLVRHGCHMVSRLNRRADIGGLR